MEVRACCGCQSFGWAVKLWCQVWFDVACMFGISFCVQYGMSFSLLLHLLYLDYE